MPIWLGVTALLVAGMVLFLRNRLISVGMVAILAGTGYLWIKIETFPYIDAVATARPVARQIQSAGVPICVKQDVPRDWRYGLNYYTVIALPDCRIDPAPRAFVYYRDHKLSVELPGPR